MPREAPRPNYNPAGDGPSKTLPSIAACFTQVGDLPITVQLSYDGVTFASAISNPALPWAASVPAGHLRTTVPDITFNFTVNATGTDNPVTYKLCDTDNECAVGTMPVGIAPNFNVVDAAIFGYLNPSLNALSTGVLSIPTDAHQQPINLRYRRRPSPCWGSSAP